jgi:hypothetical protein
MQRSAVTRVPQGRQHHLNHVSGHACARAGTHCCCSLLPRSTASNALCMHAGAAAADPEAAAANSREHVKLQQVGAQLQSYLQSMLADCNDTGLLHDGTCTIQGVRATKKPEVPVAAALAVRSARSR